MPSWANIAKSLERVIDANANTAAVTLRDGTQFTVNVAKGRARVTDLTEGIEQQRDRCTVAASTWDAVAPRPPEKGDQLLIDGRRYAVDTVRTVVVGDVLQCYRFFLEG